MRASLFRRRIAAGFALLAGILFCGAGARAAIETDPDALYRTMKQAYDEAGAHGWSFNEQSYYLATVLDAGRAYALFRADDPHYGELAKLTVDVAARVHYNPLTNDDGALWYVREAAQWTMKNDADDVDRSNKANALLERVNAGDGDPQRVAQTAEEDAVAAAADFRGDPDALVQIITADVRAYQLTHDARYRDFLLKHAADARLSLQRVPAPEEQVMLTIASQAASALPGYGALEVAEGKAIEERRARVPELQEIGSVHAIAHGLRMTRTAPADEYFGRLGFSPMGVDNETLRINRYLDVGWGTRMAKAALHLADAIEQWHKLYPRDITLPRHISACYKVLARTADPETTAAAARLRMMLLVEYANTSQAHELSESAS
jgi:hypothetical protein